MATYIRKGNFSADHEVTITDLITMGVKKADVRKVEKLKSGEEYAFTFKKKGFGDSEICIVRTDETNEEIADALAQFKAQRKAAK